jgi:CubicO group peptidase (beta-lactamase class C family)
MADALRPHVDAGEVPGVVAVVGRGDDLDVTVLGERAVGGGPMREDARFRIASAGKPVTAAAVLALVADGVLGLDDPVGELLPELAAPRVLRHPAALLDDTVPAVRPVTVAHLLRSTNGHGFPSDFDAPIVGVLAERLHQGPPPQSPPHPDEWMAALADVPLIHQPGEGFTYNTAFDVLGVLVARASGRPFPEYVAARILRPLGMVDTGFTVPAGDDGRETAYYRHADDATADDARLELVDPAVDGRWTRPPTFPSGAGGWVSTAADLVAFGRMLLDHGGDVLPAELVAAMTSDQLTPAVRATDRVFLDGQSWGFGGGVDVVTREPWHVPGRYGWVGGTGTSAHVVAADGAIAVVLTQVQLGAPGGAGVLETFWRAVTRHLGDID